MHPLQTICIPYTLDISVRFEYPSSGIVNTYPNGMTPRRYGRCYPVGGFYWTHQSGCINEFFVGFYGNKVRMCPFSQSIFLRNVCTYVSRMAGGTETCDMRRTHHSSYKNLKSRLSFLLKGTNLSSRWHQVAITNLPPGLSTLIISFI